MSDTMQIDVLDMLERLDVRNIHPASGGNEANFSCPFSGHAHGDEDPSAYMNVETTAWFCLAGETEVATRLGPRRIGELAGSTVPVMTRGGVWSVAPFSSFGEQRLMRVILSRNGVEKEIYATPEHRWFAKWSSSDKRFKALTTEQLKPLQVLASVFPKWSPVKSQTGISPTGIQHGVVYGDGHRGPEGARAELYLPKDGALLEWFPLHRFYDQGHRVVVVGLPNSFKSVPSINDGPSYLLGWLAGYFAADGSVTRGGDIVLSSADEESLEFARRVCDRLGVGSYGVRHYDRQGFESTGSRERMYEFRLMSTDLTPDFFLLPHHRDRFCAHEKKYERRRWSIQAIEWTKRSEEVFCCVVPQTHSFSLADNILTGNCWGCKERGKNAASFVMKFKGVSYNQAASWLREAYGVDFREPEGGTMAAETESRFGPKPDPAVLRVPADSWQEGFVNNFTETPGYQYARGRGFEDATMSEWGFGYDWMSDRLTLPVLDVDGRLVGFKGRTLTDRKPKYLVLGDRDPNRPRYGFDPYEASEVVFGLHRNRDVTDVVICEGELNAVALAQASVPRPVALGMSYLTDRHAVLLAQEAKRAVVFFDTDSAGEAGLEGHEQTKTGQRLPGLIEKLLPFMPVFVVPDHEGDPASMRPDEALALVRAASSTLARMMSFR